MHKQLATKAYLHALSSDNCNGQVVAQRCNLLEKCCCVEPPATCKTSHIMMEQHATMDLPIGTAMLPALVDCYHA